MTTTVESNALDTSNDNHVWPDLGVQPPKKERNAFPRAPNGRSARGRDPKKEHAGNGVSSRPQTASVQSNDANEFADLTPPTPLPEPNEAQHNDTMRSMQAEIDTLDKRMVEINAEIQNAKELRSSQGSGFQKLKTEQNEIKPKIHALSKERDEIGEQLKKLTESLKSQEAKAEKMRKDLSFGSEEEIDSAILELSKRLEASSLDLKTEKDLMKKIRALDDERQGVRDWLAEAENAKTRSKDVAAATQQRQAKIDELNQLRDREKALANKMEAIRNGEGPQDAKNANTIITSLLDEKTRLAESLKSKRAAMQQTNVSFKIAQAEFREYKAAQAAYDKKLERLEYQRRKAAGAAAAEEVAAERRRQDKVRKEERRRQEQRMEAIAAGCQLFVGGVAIRCEEAALQSYFGRFGEVTDCYLTRDPDTRLSRGFGFVTLADRDTAAAAVKAAHGAEARELCPPHGRLSVKMAEKSKMQLDFESRRPAAAKGKDASAAAAGAGEAVGKAAAAGASEAAAGPTDASSDASAEDGPAAGGDEAIAGDGMRQRPKAEGSPIAAGAGREEEVVGVVPPARAAEKPAAAAEAPPPIKSKARPPAAWPSVKRGNGGAGGGGKCGQQDSELSTSPPASLPAGAEAA